MLLHSMGEGAAVSSQSALSQETTATGFLPSQAVVRNEQRYETPKLQIFILPWSTSSPRKMLKGSFPVKNSM